MGRGAGARRRAHDDEVAPAEVGEEVGDRAGEVDLEHELAGRRDGRHGGQQPVQRVAGIGGAGPVERVLRIECRERRAVVESDAGPQRKAVVEPTGAHAPAFGERGRDAAVGLDAREALEQVRVDDVLGRLGRGRGRVEVRRLERKPDREHAVAVRRRRGGRRFRGGREGEREAEDEGAGRSAHAGSVKSACAARASTLAEFTRSSTATYSSGWWASSRMPGP